MKLYCVVSASVTHIFTHSYISKKDTPPWCENRVLSVYSDSFPHFGSITHFTHSYILKGDNPPQCEFSQCILTVRHI